MAKAHKLAVEIVTHCNTNQKKSDVMDNPFFDRLYDECFPQDDQE